MWNGSVGEVPSCVINKVPLDHVFKYSEHFKKKLPADFLYFCVLCTYIYIYICYLCIMICMHSFHSAHIFIVCNIVMCTKSFNILIL